MFPWRFYLDRFLHFLLAKSRHGTHSPFVYRLLDEVIYLKRRADEPRDRIKRLTARLVERFEPNRIYELDIGPLPEPLDFVIAKVHDAEWTTAQLGALWPKFHRGSVLMVSDIYRNTEMKRLWQSIKAKREVTVTIDLFRIGLVFFHTGQAKEHFRIR